MVRKRKDIGKWEVSLYLGGKRIRRTSPIQSRKGAQQYERQLQQEYLDSLMSKESSKKPIQIDEFAVTWLETYVAVNKRPSSLAGDERVLRLHLLPFFSGKLLDEIRSLDVERFKAAQLQKGMKKKSINNHLAVLTKLLRTADEWGYQVKIPSVKWFRDTSQRLDFLSAEEANSLLLHVDKKWYPLVLTALRTGMRRGELIALKWSCVDFILNTTTVERSDWRGILGPTKNGETRILPMSRELAEVLKRHRQHSPESEFVFCNSDGSRLRFTQIKRPIYRACREAKLRRVQWHTFRHTFASHLVMAGVGLKEVQELMGHKTLSMTLRYAHLAPNALSDAVEKLTDLNEQAKAAPPLKVIGRTA